MEQSSTEIFGGFEEPQANFTQIPNAFLEAMHIIETVGEMKVVYYILRHTWGFKDKEKKITLDEFANGRKKRDGTRLDKGTGLTIPTIRDGLKRAQEHGFILVETDDGDRARIKKFYSLNMKGERNLQPDCKNLSVCVKDSFNRTEKETIERNPRNTDAGASELLPEPEYVDLDGDGFPTKATPPLVKHLRDSGRNITANQADNLSRRVVILGDEYPSPYYLYENDPLFKEYVNHRLAWCNGTNSDGKRYSNGTVVSSIRRYDTKYHGWFDFRDRITEQEHSIPAGAERVMRNGQEVTIVHVR